MVRFILPCREQLTNEGLAEAVKKGCHDFSHTEFITDIHFEGNHTDKDWDFTGSIFRRKVLIDGLTSDGTTCFESVTFDEDAVITNCSSGKMSNYINLYIGTSLQLDPSEVKSDMALSLSPEGKGMTSKISTDDRIIQQMVQGMVWQGYMTTYDGAQKILER